MDIRREIRKCFAHGNGVIVRVRWIAVDADGKDIYISRPVSVTETVVEDGKVIIKTKETVETSNEPVHFDIEKKITEPWREGDTHESYVGRAIDSMGIVDEIDKVQRIVPVMEVVQKAIEKILLHNGLMSPKFEVPTLESPKRF